MIRLAIDSPGPAIDLYAGLDKLLHEVHIAAYVDPHGFGGGAGGAIPRYESLEQALSDSAAGIDGVVFHQFSDSTHVRAMEAAKRGKHICASVPMAATERDSADLVRICRANGVTLMLGNPLRFCGVNREVARVRRVGLLGKPGLLRIHHWNCPADLHAEDPRLCRFLLMTAELDLALHLFQSPPSHVVGREAGGHGQTAASTQIHLGFPAGGMALLARASCAPPSIPYWSMTLIGEAGAAYVDDQRNAHLQVSAAGWNSLRADQYCSALATQLREFGDAITHGRVPAATGDEACMAQRVAQAAAASCARADVVHLSESE